MIIQASATEKVRSWIRRRIQRCACKSRSCGGRLAMATRIFYDVELSFESETHKVLDKKTFKAGVRQFTYNEDGDTLRIFINGRRFVARGGNWGFSESMLRYRAREYDASVRYHREMNFTMIRNWVGQIGEVAFYDACDKYGVVVWQDFWLANPWDGPIPNDNDLFMTNVRDLIPEDPQPPQHRSLLRTQRVVSAATARCRHPQRPRRTPPRHPLHRQFRGQGCKRPRPIPGAHT